MGEGANLNIGCTMNTNYRNGIILTRIKSEQDIEEALGHLIKLDPQLKAVLKTVRSAGLKVPLRLRPGGFGGLAEIVISQLVSKASANAIHQRFLSHISPLTPQSYLEAGAEVWKKIGLSRPKQTTLVAISEAIINGQLDLENIGNLQVGDAQKHLVSIKGIGPWSAHVYLLFCEGHRDIFPSGDLALSEAARIIWSLDERPRDKELEQHALKWSPWRGVAARLLWAFYAVNKGGKVVNP